MNQRKRTNHDERQKQSISEQRSERDSDKDYEQYLVLQHENSSISPPITSELEHELGKVPIQVGRRDCPLNRNQSRPTSRSLAKNDFAFQ